MVARVGDMIVSVYRDMSRYKALVHALVVRHLSSRYRGSMLGFLWTLLSPLCLMAVYTLVFTFYVRGFEVDHYPIFLFVGLLPWIWSSSALNEGTGAVVASGHLITKSMFPPQILPLVSVVTTMINFVLSLPLLFLFMALSGRPFHATLLLVPVVVVIHLLLLLGLVLVLSALNVFYRDVQHLIANVLTLIFFLCPIIYPATSVPEKFQVTLAYNPLAALTILYHNLIIDGVIPELSLVLPLIAATAISLIIGAVVFDRFREGFAEVL
jgi:lipopolysaccharide transport system permease protein